MRCYTVGRFEDDGDDVDADAPPEDLIWGGAELHWHSPFGSVKCGIFYRKDHLAL
jgi:hypothetical protein